MKLNNKGFAISTIMYMILIMAIVLITLTLSILSARKLILDKIRKETNDNIYNAYEITYRQALETLKEEAIAYGIDNNVSKESIKISDINSSIDQEILDGYNLSDKYLTIVSNGTSYDVYLGKSKTITNINDPLDTFIDILDYKIYGNSIQDGIPTITSPQEIRDFGNNGNLFNEDEWIEQWTGESYNDSKKITKTTYQSEECYYLTFSSFWNSEYVPKGIKADTQYTLSADFISPNSGGFRIVYTDGTKQYIDSGTTGSTWTNYRIVTKAGKTLKSIQGNGATGNGYAYVKNIQLEEGVNKTEYAPYGKCIIPIKINNGDTLKQTLNVYLDEPLRKIGDYADYIDFKEGKVVRKIFVRLFDGNEKIFGASTNTDSNLKIYNYNWTGDGDAGVFGSKNYLAKSNYFSFGGDNLTTMQDNYFYNHSYYLNGRVFMATSKYDTEDSFKEWLSSLYAAGKPLKIYKIRTEPLEESITLPNVDSIGEYTNISIDTSIAPSKVEFTVIERIIQI